MNRYGELSNSQKECLSIALQGGNTLLGMINDLLDISKMEDGSLQLEYCDIDPCVLMQNCVQQITALATNSGVSIEITTNPELPRLKADEEKLQRALTNLLGNAIKFTPSGGTIRAMVQPGEEPYTIQFMVADTGEGIPAADFDRIFEKFGQVESHQSGRKMSTGLGLTYCKMVVEAHNGRIWIESKIGQGSTFSFSVPCQKDHLQSETPR